MKSFAKLPTFDPETGDALAVIETPKGSRNSTASTRLWKFSSSQGPPSRDAFPL